MKRMDAISPHVDHPGFIGPRSMKHLDMKPLCDGDRQVIDEGRYRFAQVGAREARAQGPVVARLEEQPHLVTKRH